MVIEVNRENKINFSLPSQIRLLPFCFASARAEKDYEQYQVTFLKIFRNMISSEQMSSPIYITEIFVCLSTTK